MISFFGYKLCLLDLITDKDTRQISASKLWMQIGYAVLTFVIIKEAMIGHVDAELFLLYGLIVAGNYTALKFVKLKYGAINAVASEANGNPRGME